MVSSWRDGNYITWLFGGSNGKRGFGELISAVRSGHRARPLHHSCELRADWIVGKSALGLRSARVTRRRPDLELGTIQQ
jgi:hypothetical protein